LETELSSYSTVWDARKGTFNNILNNLEVLRREVEDEKEQQDRREGMDEGSDHDEEEGQITGIQTPAVKDTDERREREQSRDSGEVDEEVGKDRLDSPGMRSGTPATRDGDVDMEGEDETEQKGVERESKMDVDR
jgi:hypothetical protein